MLIMVFELISWKHFKASLGQFLDKPRKVLECEDSGCVEVLMSELVEVYACRLLWVKSDARIVE